MPQPVKSAGRKKLKQRLAQYLSRTTRPRVLMTTALVTTGASGFLLSHLMREFGLCMAIRYPLAVLGAWGVFLLLIWLWVVWQRHRIEQAVETLTISDNRLLESVHSGGRGRKLRLLL